MQARAFHLFETPIGTCGVVWSPRGIAGIQLPEGSPAATRRRLVKRFSGAFESPPPEEVVAAIAAIVALLGGEARDLRELSLDLDGVPPFERRVYQAAREIPPGSTLTYGEIAARIGAPGAARAVGRALGRNPFAIVVPCHRVLGAGGKPGGFSAAGGVATKRRMLAIEGAERTLFDPP